MMDLLAKPFVGIATVLVLAFIDYPLTAISRSSYQKYMSGFIEYRSLKSKGRSGIGFIWVVIKILIAVLLYFIWLIYAYGGYQIAGVLYLWLLGFTIGSYFVIDLRHVESIFLSRLYNNSELVSGKITYQSRFSMKISAVQYLSIFIIFSLAAILTPSYFTLGLACAPFFLAIRNLVLS